jgi:hypothetical protein
MYNKPQIIINTVTALFLLLSWIFVSLRCYVRIFIQAYFGLDDIFAIACLVCSAYANVKASRVFADILLKASFSALSAVVFYGTSVAIGKHIFNLKIEQIGQGLKVRTSISRKNTATD